MLDAKMGKPRTVIDIERAAKLRTGHEVAEPAAGDPFTPFYVSLERHCGLGHTVVAVPGVTRRSEAIRLADAPCRAEFAAYQKEVTAILRRYGVWELFNKLNRLKAEAKDVVVVLGRAPTPPEGPRVLNPEAPDAATLAERRLARTNKFRGAGGRPHDHPGCAAASSDP